MGWIRLCWVCNTWGDQLQLCRRFNIILAIQTSPIAMHWWKDSVIFSGSLGFNLDPWQEVGEDELNSVLLRIGEICHHYMKKWWNRQMKTSQYEVLLCPWMPIWKRAEAIWALASDNLFAWQGRSWGQHHCHHLGFRHHLCQHIYNFCRHHHDMFVRGSKLLILDEATSSLDGDTDQHIGQLVEHQHQHLYLYLTSSYAHSDQLLFFSYEMSSVNAQCWQLHTGWLGQLIICLVFHIVDHLFDEGSGHHNCTQFVWG